MTENPMFLKLDGMESFLPNFEGTLRLAYPLGTYGQSWAGVDRIESRAPTAVQGKTGYASKRVRCDK